MSKCIMVCVALSSACSLYGLQGSDAGVDAGTSTTSDAICITGDQSSGECPTGGSGTNGGGGGDAGTAVQLCESSAREQCSNLGFPGNSYCILVFSQGCSPADQQRAIDYCVGHPYIRHDDQCHPQW